MRGAAECSGAVYAGSMRRAVFLFEAVTGSCELPLDNSLLREGVAMIRGLASDFLQLPDVDVHLLRRPELRALDLPGTRVVDVTDAEHEEREFARLCRDSTWSCLIAPELDGCLGRHVTRAESLGARLLSPNAPFVQIAGDKHMTCERLRAAEVPVPRGIRLDDAANVTTWELPAVLKRRDGAGSTGVELVSAGYDRLEQLCRARSELDPHAWRLETFIPGTPASVAVLCGTRQQIPLPAARQRLLGDGQFAYVGGALPLPQPLRGRAERLASLAVAALPTTVGYVGVDLVLGSEPSGRADAVIEVNPRLTTSYVGLRALARVNLAAAMIALAEGKEVELSFHAGGLEFDADGTVRHRQES